MKAIAKRAVYAMAMLVMMVSCDKDFEPVVIQKPLEPKDAVPTVLCSNKDFVMMPGESTDCAFAVQKLSESGDVTIEVTRGLSVTMNLNKDDVQLTEDKKNKPYYARLEGSVRITMKDNASDSEYITITAKNGEEVSEIQLHVGKGYWRIKTVEDLYAPKEQILHRGDVGADTLVINLNAYSHHLYVGFETNLSDGYDAEFKYDPIYDCPYLDAHGNPYCHEYLSQNLSLCEDQLDFKVVVNDDRYCDWITVTERELPYVKYSCLTIKDKAGRWEKNIKFIHDFARIDPAEMEHLSVLLGDPSIKGMTNREFDKKTQHSFIYRIKDDGYYHFWFIPIGKRYGQPFLDDKESWRFPYLEELSFGNWLNLPFPSVINDASLLPRIKKINAAGSEFTGPFPELNNLTTLEKAYFSDNFFTGNIPVSWADMPNMASGYSFSWDMNCMSGVVDQRIVDKYGKCPPQNEGYHLYYPDGTEAPDGWTGR